MNTLCKLLLTASFATLAGHALGQGSSITYQGRLMSGTNGVNGTYDFRFAAFDALAAGNQVGSTVNLAGVGVTDGLFTVVLDFSTQVFDGSNRWLEIAARTNGSVVAFAPMTPRQALTPTPYAIKAGGAATADVAATVSGVVPASKIGGALTLAQLPAGVITNNVASMVVGDLSVTNDAVIAGVLSVKRLAQFDLGLEASGLRLSGDRSFGLDNAVCFIENRAERSESPALRVVSHALVDAAALSVSQLHQGLIAQFGNADRWVASIDSQGNMTAASYAGDGSGLSNIAASALVGTLPAAQLPANLALRDAAQTFSARNTFAQELTLLGGTAAQYPLDVHGTAHAGSPDAGTLQITDNAMDVGLRLRNTSAAGRTWSLFSSGTGSGLGAGSFSIWDREAQAARLSIAPNGYVGIGTTSPGAALDVNTGAGNIQLRSDGVTPCINVANSPNPGILRLRDQLQIFPSDDGKRAGLLDVRDQSGNSTVRITGDQGGMLEAQVIELRDDAGRQSIALNGRTGDFFAKTALFFGDTGDTIYLNGANGTVMASAFNTTSDRNAKEEFRSVDPRAVLEKVTSLPLSEWQFKGTPETRHIGPMAQDFHAAFGVGPDDRHIATVDADGVALAAIQGLNQALQEAVKAKDAEIGQLRQDVAELRARVEKLAQSK